MRFLLESASSACNSMSKFGITNQISSSGIYTHKLGKRNKLRSIGFFQSVNMFFDVFTTSGNQTIDGHIQNKLFSAEKQK